MGAPKIAPPPPIIQPKILQSYSNEMNDLYSGNPLPARGFQEKDYNKISQDIVLINKVIDDCVAEKNTSKLQEVMIQTIIQDRSDLDKIQQSPSCFPETAERCSLLIADLETTY